VPSGHLAEEEDVVTDEAENTTANEAKGSAAQGIRDLVERTFLAGMGAAALTKDRIQDLVEEFVRRGQLNTDEGREVVERVVTRSREEARSVLKKADSSLQGAYRDLGLTTKRELEDVEFRLRQLEHRVQLLEAAADGEAAGEATARPAGE
jgi:polyhydroxyalkanoate synthesis regulator phasin